MYVSKNVALRPDQYEALQKMGGRQGNQIIRDALDIFFAHQSSIQQDDRQNAEPIVDLSEGALTPYPRHSTHVTILRDTPASPLPDLIEQSDLPDGSADDAE